MIRIWQQTNELGAQIDEVTIDHDQDQTVRVLEVLCYIGKMGSGDTADLRRAIVPLIKQ